MRTRQGTPSGSTYSLHVIFFICAEAFSLRSVIDYANSSLVIKGEWGVPEENCRDSEAWRLRSKDLGATF